MLAQWAHIIITVMRITGRQVGNTWWLSISLAFNRVMWLLFYSLMLILCKDMGSNRPVYVVLWRNNVEIIIVNVKRIIYRMLT